MKTHVLLILISLCQLTSLASNNKDSVTTRYNKHIITIPDSSRINIHREEIIFPKTVQFENSKSLEWTEQMPWVVALIIGTISFWLGNRQLTLQRNLKVSEFRQQWIDNVRNSICEYLAKIEHYGLLIDSNRDDYYQSRSVAQHPLQQEIYTLENKITLLFNPNEERSNALRKNMNTYTRSVFGHHTGELTQEDLKAKILEDTSIILKTEWELVKNEGGNNFCRKFKKNFR